MKRIYFYKNYDWFKSGFHQNYSEVYFLDSAVPFSNCSLLNEPKILSSAVKRPGTSVPPQYQKKNNNP